ncbi:hypothetical protein [Pseudoxanthomonas mexicana]|uniref:hypothetical protein n=1 Tax=Pseudoxanthomonas mexicana TaxID=128785 RepID=UPI001FD7121E|nr:hypothetical protein [Pseudoxanthomonas mexicana]UOV03128.1 hypothetical protein MUU73_07890 [Pseudoxanthomonas mexicana]
MKILGAPLLLMSTCLVSCAPQKPGQIYRGTYFQNFESSAFIQEDSNEPWCVNAAEMAKAQPTSRGSSTADVVVRGELSPEGSYCNLGAYKHMLKVYEVLEVSNMQSGN